MSGFAEALLATMGQTLLGIIGPTTVDTSSAATATAYSNQRKVDRTQNGVLWVCLTQNDNTARFLYSQDDGATWTVSGTTPMWQDSGSGSYFPNRSFFIDVDDYAHLVYKERDTGYIKYKRGTPNAGRTDWTWSSANLLFTTVDTANYPDVIAHREGSGWVAHAVWSRSVGAGVYHQKVEIDSGGSFTIPTHTVIGDTYDNSTHKFPSIDFNHTGDGKTVAGSTPHLYAAWSAGDTGSGKGIRFRKATYSSGSWTWGTEREIDSTRYVQNEARWMNCLFDGTRVIMLGWVDDGSDVDLVLYERDAADTTTTERVLLNNPAATADVFYGSSTYDGDGNVYMFGRNTDSVIDLIWYKWDRATTTLSAATVLDDSGSIATPYVSAKRGYSNSRIEFIYTDGTADPYDINFYGMDT